MNVSRGAETIQCTCIIIIYFFQARALEQKLVQVLKLDFSIICLHFHLRMVIPYFQP